MSDKCIYQRSKLFGFIVLLKCHLLGFLAHSFKYFLSTQVVGEFTGLNKTSLPLTTPDITKYNPLFVSVMNFGTVVYIEMESGQ